MKLIISLSITLLLSFNLYATEIEKFYITCSPDDLKFIYENPTEDNYIPITLTYGSQTWQDLELRIRGDGSRAYPKKSLKIKFTSERFIDGREELNLNAEYLDKSYIKQFISSIVMRESGQPCFKAEHSLVYINGYYSGLFLRVENIDEDFLQSWGLDPTGNLYKATYDGACLSEFDDVSLHWEKKTNKSTERDDLARLIEKINSVTDKEYNNFTKEYFDYPKMINIIALNILLANASTYSHNYFMYHDLKPNGKWVMFPWDLDKTLSYYGIDCPFHFSSLPSVPDNPFLERALMNPQIFSDIKNRIDEIVTIVFNINRLGPIIDSLKEILKPAIAADTCDKITNLSEFEDELNFQLYSIEKRPEFVRNQLNNYPSVFKVDRIPLITTGQIKYRWHPSKDPNGQPITYSLIYGHDPYFLDSTTKKIENINDTSYILKAQFDSKKYYSEIIATNGKNFTEGFDNFNPFYYKQGTTLQCLIEGKVELTKAQSPYIVDCNITINPGAELIIDKGVEIRMNDTSRNIFVKGKLTIRGTKDEPVYIMPDAGVDFWGKIDFRSTTGESIIRNAVILEGIVEAYQGPLDFDSVKFIVIKKQLTYQDSLNQTLTIPQINHVGESLGFRNCYVQGNRTGEGLIIYGATPAIIENSYFVDTPDGVELINCKDGIIRGNEIRNSPDDGIDLDACTNILISDNRIFDSFDKGISIGKFGNDSTKNTIIKNNLIVGNDIAIALIDGTDAQIINNTLYNNNISVSCYEKWASGLGGGHAYILNTILAGSKKNVISLDSLSSAIIEYSLCDTKLLEGKGNINDDPKFISPLESNFRLLKESPCINSGAPASPPDPDGTRADIGAYYFNMASDNIVINEINYNSSVDFDTEDWVELYNPGADSVDLSGWVFKDEDDSHIYTLPLGTTIKSKGYLVLCKDITMFSKLLPDVKNSIGSFGFGLNGAGELIRLYNKAGLLIDTVLYDDTAPWPTEPDGNGPTLELISPELDNALAENWKASKLSHGTPGSKNSSDTSIGEPIAWDSTNIIQMRQNFPNPFSNHTILPIKLLGENEVNIFIYDSYGRRIKYNHNEKMGVGTHYIDINLPNLAQGVYFFVLEGDGKYISMPFVISK